MGQYLTFRVGRQDFAIDAGRVRGLLPAQDVVPVEIPDSCICGFASMHGREFPVIDLRRKLRIAPALRAGLPYVVVVEEPQLFGFVADRVSQIITLREQHIRNGMVRTNGRSRRVLDPGRLIDEAELISVWRPQLNP